MCNAVQLCLAANNILHMRKGNCAFFLLAIALAWKWQFASLPRIFIKKQTLWLNDKAINYWTCMVIAKYRDLSVSRRSIICLSLRPWEIIDLLATEKKTIFCSTLSNKLLIICVSNNLRYLHVYVVLENEYSQFWE